MVSPDAAFDSINDVQARLKAQNYICDDNIATVVYLATRLGKPGLVNFSVETEPAPRLSHVRDSPPRARSPRRRNRRGR